MFILDVSARKINLRGPTQDTLVSDSLNVYPCRFFFTHDWDGLVKTAVFKSGDAVKEIILDETNECQIPWETLVRHNQDLFVGVYGIRYKTEELHHVEDGNGEEDDGEEKGEEPNEGIKTLSEEEETEHTNYDEPTEPENPDKPEEEDVVTKSELILNTIWKNIGRIHEGTKNVDNGVPEPPTPSIYEQIIGKIGNMKELKTTDKSSLVSAINEVYRKIANTNVGEDGPFPSVYVKSFNGRTGSVIPRKGDYTAEMVGAVSKEDYDKFQEDFDDFVKSINQDISDKVDKTGGTVTGPIMFTEDGAQTVSDDSTSNSATGTVVSSSGILYTGNDTFAIRTTNAEIDLSSGEENTILYGVEGIESVPNSVPNMEQLNAVKESVKQDIPTKTSELLNDSNFATKEYVQDTLGSIDIGGDGMVNDHRLLQHRDAENQHPISAITDLQDILDTIPIPMTAEQLRKILMSEGEN